MDFHDAGQDIIDAIIQYSSWSHAPSSAPEPITIAATWEGPLPFFIDDFENATYPVLVVLPNVWPSMSYPQLHQIGLTYSGTLNYLYQASPGENPFEKARDGISKVYLNLIGSNRLGLTWINDITFGSIRYPDNMEIMQYLFGLKIAATTLDFTISTTLVV